MLGQVRERIRVEEIEDVADRSQLLHAGRDADQPQRETHDVAVQRVIGQIGLLGREARAAQAAEHGVDVPQPRGADPRPRQQAWRRPWMTPEHVVRRRCRALDRRLPVRPGIRQVHLVDHAVDHEAEQLVLAGHVVVGGHRPGPQILGEAAHRERGDPVAVRQLDGSREHAVAAQSGRPRNLGHCVLHWSVA